MLKVEVFDPPMCCTTGICGSSSDPTLVVFASDLEWLKTKGVDVVRHGLSLHPAEFAKNETVKNLVNKEGNGCLPIILVDKNLASKSCYPSREKLAQICNIPYDEEEAPPIHREENCCCGVDCDCTQGQIPEGPCSCTVPNCNCTNAASEDNCTCPPICDCELPEEKSNFRNILFIILFLTLICILVLKFLF